MTTTVFVAFNATQCSAICVPDRPIKPLLLQLFVQKKEYRQQSVGPVKMAYYRQGQNHILLFPHSVSKLTFPIATHCRTSVGSTHILVALQRGWEKDCCYYVHLALVLIDSNKKTAKSRQDVQNCHDHVRHATMHPRGQEQDIWQMFAQDRPWRVRFDDEFVKFLRAKRSWFRTCMDTRKNVNMTCTGRTPDSVVNALWLSACERRGLHTSNFFYGTMTGPTRQSSNQCGSSMSSSMVAFQMLKPCFWNDTVLNDIVWNVKRETFQTTLFVPRTGLLYRVNNGSLRPCCGQKA